MEEVIQIGTTKYIATKDENDREFFKRKGKIGDKEIDIVIKNGDTEQNEGIEAHIVSVLSQLYMERILKNI